MYGPRSAYDSATLAEWDRQAKHRVRRDELLALLRDPAVLAELPAIMQEAARLECERVARAEGQNG